MSHEVSVPLDSQLMAEEPQENPHILRREGNNWLAFDTITHSVTVLDAIDSTEQPFPSNVIRAIESDEVCGALTAPLKLFVSVSDRCNLTCEHCMSSSSPEGETSLSVTEIKQLADEAEEMGVFLMIIGGGEPLIYPGIWDAVEYVRSKHIGVSLTTNGIVLRDNDIVNLKKYQVRTNVSIDGSPETHDRIRGKLGAFERTLSNIRRLIGAGINPTIRWTMMNSNLQDTEFMINLADNLSLQLKPRRAKPSGRVMEGDDIITEPTEAYFDAVQRLNAADNCGIEDLMSLDASTKDHLLLSNVDCGAGTRIAFIDEDGTMSPCTFLGESFTSGRYSYGALKKAWAYDKSFKQMRDIPQNNECSGCAREAICHAECPAMRLHTGGSLDSQDPGCIKPLVVRLGHTIERRK